MHQHNICNTSGIAISKMYTKELIDKTIRLFAEEHNVVISEDTAVVYLNSFADLYKSVIELLRHTQGLEKVEKSGIIRE